MLSDIAVVIFYYNKQQFCTSTWSYLFIQLDWNFVREPRRTRKYHLASTLYEYMDASARTILLTVCLPVFCQTRSTAAKWRCWLDYSLFSRNRNQKCFSFPIQHRCQAFTHISISCNCTISNHNVFSSSLSCAYTQIVCVFLNIYLVIYLGDEHHRAVPDGAGLRVPTLGRQHARGEACTAGQRVQPGRQSLHIPHFNQVSRYDWRGFVVVWLCGRVHHDKTT